MKKKQTIKDISFADLVAMRMFAIELKFAPRRSREKWQLVIGAIEQEMHRRIELARRLPA